MALLRLLFKTVFPNNPEMDCEKACNKSNLESLNGTPLADEPVHSSTRSIEETRLDPVAIPPGLAELTGIENHNRRRRPRRPRSQATEIEMNRIQTVTAQVHANHPLCPDPIYV